MITTGRRPRIVFFISLGTCLVAVAVALNVGWIVVNWRTTALMLLGAALFVVVIAGLILNTTFLVREIRRNEQHDTFINAVTHELKTPVASIRLYLETLQARELTEAQRGEFYRIMLADSDRLLQTIEQILRAGKDGPGLRHRAPIDLGELTRECLVLARTRHRLPEASMVWQNGLARGDRAIVLGDFDDLQAAVLNLLDNAVKYSGSTVHVKAEVARIDARRVAVRVRDQGAGIPSDQLKRIFRRFYRMPDSVALRVKGTGLGLFIVRSVAEKHGGRAFAESSGVGQGSVFTIQLPTAPPSL